MVENLESESRYSGNLSALQIETEYRSLKDSPSHSFYAKCLRNSSLYERAVGYFSSSVFLVVGGPIADFASVGGKMRLICSPNLTREDIDAIISGRAKREAVLSGSLISEFDQLLENEETRVAAQALSTLIASGTLQIKIATRKGSLGLYHEKLGIFTDAFENSVSFRGSTNETWNGWHDQGNFETIEVFCTWRGGLEEERVSKHKHHFDTMWSGADPDLDIEDFPETAEEYVRRYSLGNLSNLPREHVKASLKPKGRDPLSHQKTALEAWSQQGHRGIFEHATGTGKTFTALLAIRDHVRQGRSALILVPSELLHKQWHAELLETIPEATVLLAGAGATKWKQAFTLEAMVAADKSLGARIVLSTMQTASTDLFIKAFRDGSDLLVVADEVHQIGSTNNSKALQIPADKRLGLSATPIRFGDPEGTQRIFEYFGPVVPPAISLSDAVKMDRLVPYLYYPHPISLTAEEADEWSVSTAQIRKEFAKSKRNEQGQPVISDRVKMLLINRSRIAKKASSKVQLASQVVYDQYEDGQSWLVYCEDSDQLTQVLDSLRTMGLSPIEYHSNMVGDREATLQWFRKFGGVLVSIKCLDEGVDIPAVSHALILASSQNPRQFIQRRGRVLRKDDGKNMAVIHDAIVVPLENENESDQMSLLTSELARAVEFADNAINRDASAELRDIAMTLQLDLDEVLAERGFENDDQA